MVRARSLNGNLQRGWELGAHLIKSIIIDIYPLTVSYITQKKKLVYHQYLVSTRFLSTFDSRYEPAAACSHLRYSVLYTYIKLWQTTTYEHDIMKVENNIALNSEMTINTQFKNTLSNYTESCIITTTLVLLHVDWELETKRAKRK